MIDNKVELVKEHVAEIMRILEIPTTEGNALTPLRIAKMYTNELFRNRNNYHIEELDASFKTFPISDSSGGLVVVKGIPFHSVCEHHWLPFSGRVNVAYLPRTQVLGLSKIPRTVKFFSQKPQLQERLVEEIAQYLFEHCDASFVFVHAIATHSCIACRGAEVECETDTSAMRFRGMLRAQAMTYAEEYYARLR